MKTLLRLFLVFVVLLALIAGVLFFTLTRPSVQKSLIEGQLPEGSSLRSVRITSNSLELSELKLNLPDGTRVRLGRLESDLKPFKPLAALFDRSLTIGALRLDGLVVEIPQRILAHSDAPVGPAFSGTVPQLPPEPVVLPDTPTAVSANSSSLSEFPIDALYAIGQLDWLLEIESIELAGELRDAGGAKFAFNINSGAIRPGVETSLEANVALSSRDALHAGLREFDSTVRLFLKQSSGGGFEELRLESVSRASDGIGNPLFSATQQLELELKGFEENAVLDLAFNADLPRPVVFVPEMAGAGALAIEGYFSASSEGQVLRINGAELLVASEGQPTVKVDLKKEFSLGGQHDLSGELMDVTFTELPLSWLAPWIPSGYRLQGEDFSASFNLTGMTGGGIELRSRAPVRIGPLSFDSAGARVLDSVTISFLPLIQVASDGALTWNLGDFQISDPYGELVSGSSTGEFDPTVPSSGLFPAGLKTETKLDVRLQELMQQPILANRSSILAGRATLRLGVDPSLSKPVQLQGLLKGISAQAYPGQREDYRYALELNQTEAGAIVLGANLLVGAEERPSSDVQLSGQVRPGSFPLQFQADLYASRLSQRDLEFLAAAFSPRSQVQAPLPSSGHQTSTPANQQDSRVPPVSSDSPPWAGYEGELGISVEEFVLLSGDVISGGEVAVSVTEPLLRLERVKASVGEGRLEGGGEVSFSDRDLEAYGFRVDLEFDDLDPAVLSKKRSGSFPVQGLFDGEARFAGKGASLAAAIDDFEGELRITGRDGIFTAFELDNRSQLGLIGASLLGQHLKRPEVAAVTNAIPYFQNLRFESFTMGLNRGSDKQVKIPLFQLKADSLFLDGNGQVSVSEMSQIRRSPMSVELQIGAKGQLADHLNTLELLGDEVNEAGYSLFQDVVFVRGTIGKPDTSQLRKMLWDAVSRAGRAAPSGGAETSIAAEAGSGDQGQEQESDQTVSPRKKSKEERLLEDIQAGAELLNTLFGN